MNDGLMKSLANVLGEVGRRSLAATTLEAAKSKLMHALGVSLSSSQLAPPVAVWQMMKHGSGDCLVIGQRQRLSADDAAFVNGVTGHSSLLEDAGPGGLREGSHPGPYIIPAALAAAEAGHFSGARFLAGLVVGYEAVTRVGAAAPASIVSRRFRPLGIMGPIGAAAAVATVLGADDRQLAAALSIATNMSAGTTQGIFEGSMEPYIQAGMGARNGLFAARLGLSNVLTAGQSLEGDFGFFQTYGGEAGDADRLLAPSTRLGIEQVGIKQFAACLQNQHTVGLILKHLPQPLEAEAIERVTITRPAAGTNGLNSPGVSRLLPFNNMLEAQMSARFTAASALLGLPVDDPMFFQRSFGDARIAALTVRMDLVPAADESVVVNVLLRSGQMIRLEDASLNVLGPSVDHLRAKFLQRTRPLLGDQADVALACIEDLENLADVGVLTRSLTIP